MTTASLLVIVEPDRQPLPQFALGGLMPQPGGAAGAGSGAARLRYIVPFSPSTSRSLKSPG